MLLHVKTNNSLNGSFNLKCSHKEVFSCHCVRGFRNGQFKQLQKNTSNLCAKWVCEAHKERLLQWLHRLNEMSHSEEDFLSIVRRCAYCLAICSWYLHFKVYASVLNFQFVELCVCVVKRNLLLQARNESSEPPRIHLMHPLLPGKRAHMMGPSKQHSIVMLQWQNQSTNVSSKDAGLKLEHSCSVCTTMMVWPF